MAGEPYSYLRQSSWKSQPSCLQHQLRWPQLPLNHRPRPRPPERLCRHQRRNTNANSATELSAAANIEVGTNGRVSQNIFLVVCVGQPVKSRTEGQVPNKVFSLLTWTSQTPKRDPFNARNVEAPSFVETFSYATTGPSMQKIREYLWCQEEESVAGPSHHQTQGRQSRR